MRSVSQLVLESGLNSLKENRMIELKKHELEQVDGGLVPLVVGAGFAVGMALAYMTRK